MAMAWRIASAEARGGFGALRLLFVCLFLGVLALAGVGSLARAIEKGLTDEGQVILGGDVAVQISQRPPTATELAQLAATGGTVSQTVQMQAMVRTGTRDSQRRLAEPDGQRRLAEPDNQPLLAELKAIDAGWPLYGEAQLVGGGGNAAVQAALARGIVVSAALAERLHLRIGDPLSIGEATLPVTAILATEPDRASNGFALGPTLLLALPRLPETGLVAPGSLYSTRLRLRLPAGADAVATARSLKESHPDAGWQISDSHHAAPGVQRFVDRLAQLLMLVSLTALCVAGIGARNGVAAYLGRRTSTIATLKTLGATSGQVTRGYLLLIAAVALAAATAGVAVGALAPWLTAHLAGDLLPVPPATGLYPRPLLAAAGYGLLIAFAFAFAPLAQMGALPVAHLLRGHAAPWPWPAGRALAGSLLAGAAVVALAAWQATQPLLVLLFAAGALAVFGLLALLGTLIVGLARRAPRPQALLVRLALASLCRPGAPTRALVIALGLGLSLFATLIFIETSFDAELQQTVPAKAPAFFLLDLPKEDKSRFLAMLPPASAVRLVPSLRGPVTQVNGRPVASLTDVPDESYVLRGDRGLTFATDVPAGNRIVEGRWWPADYQGPPLVSMDATQARLLGLKVGDSITVSVLGADITATIASLREVNWNSFGFNFVLVYDPATLAAAPYSFMATVTPPAARRAGFTARFSHAFPTATVIDTGEVLADVGRLAGQLGVAVKVAAMAAILAGIAVLIGTLAAQARQRLADNVILKLLGATRRQLMAAAAIEYAALGLILALLALALAALAGWLVVRHLLDLHWAPDWGHALLVVSAGAVLTCGLGLTGSWRALGAGVRQILRQE